MKKNSIIPLSLALGIVLLGVSTAAAAGFSQNLRYGTTHNAQVSSLQQFLKSQGYFSIQPTGNFLSLTKAALEKFQASQGIPATGYFGPLTISAANNLTAPAATVAVSAVTPVNAAAVSQVGAQTIAWQTSDYPASAGVNVNLLKKVSGSPAAYSLVQEIASDVPNSGSIVWTPAAGETSPNLYVEVTCANASQTSGACKVAGQPISID